jgi:hypothetical protein
MMMKAKILAQQQSATTPKAKFQKKGISNTLKGTYDDEGQNSEILRKLIFADFADWAIK